MDEDEHEVYGGEIPDVLEMEGDMEALNADVEMTSADADALKELNEMKKRLKEMEEEAAAFREMQAKMNKVMGAAQVPVNVADCRSVFVGNVDYACTPEEVQQYFQSCGTVNRVTIPTDKFGQPKGFAFVEFVELKAIRTALNLNESELHGRQLKVLPKRTNVPGFKQYRPMRFNPFFGYKFKRPYMSYSYLPYGYGKFPRFRKPIRYRAYA